LLALGALLLLVLSAAASGAPSRCAFDLQGYSYNLSSLMGKDLVGSDGTPQYTYFLSVCGALTSSDASTCVMENSQSSACQIQVQGDMQTFDIGNWDTAAPPQWSFINASAPELGVQYQMLGATQCWANGAAPAPYIATVQFQCAAEQGALKVSSAPQSCAKTYAVPTPLACPSTPPPPQCNWISPANGFSYDLSPLMGKELVGSDGSHIYAYYLSVCGSLNSTATNSCTTINAHSSVCQIDPESRAFDLGDWDAVPSPQWSFINESAPELGVQYKLQGAMQCWATGSASPYFATVQFQCAREQSAVSVQHSPNTCEYVAVVPTPFACWPNGTVPGESAAEPVATSSSLLLMALLALLGRAVA